MTDAPCPPDGALRKEKVLAVLGDNGVAIKTEIGGKAIVLSKDDVIEAQFFPDHISRGKIHHLARKFKIDVYRFYVG